MIYKIVTLNPLKYTELKNKFKNFKTFIFLDFIWILTYYVWNTLRNTIYSWQYVTESLE